MNRSKLLIIGLALSISINLFLIGGIAMRISNMRDYTQARPFPPNLGWIVRDLDEARQEELAELLQPLGEQVAPYRRAMMDAQSKVHRLMGSSDLDMAELDAAFTTLREAARDYAAITHEQALSVLGELTAEERQAAIEFIQRRGPRDGRDNYRSRSSRVPN